MPESEGSTCARTLIKWPLVFTMVKMTCPVRSASRVTAFAGVVTVNRFAIICPYWVTGTGDHSFILRYILFAVQMKWAIDRSLMDDAENKKGHDLVVPLRIDWGKRSRNTRAAFPT